MSGGSPPGRVHPEGAPDSESDPTIVAPAAVRVGDAMESGGNDPAAPGAGLKAVPLSNTTPLQLGTMGMKAPPKRVNTVSFGKSGAPAKSDLERIGIDLRSLVVPDDLKGMLTEWDANGDGNLNLAELIEAANKSVNLKKDNTRLRWLALIVTVLALCFFGAMLGVVISAIQLMKDMKPSTSGELTTTSGQAITTGTTMQYSGLGALYGQTAETLRHIKDVVVSANGVTNMFVISGFSVSSNGTILFYSTRGDGIQIISADTVQLIPSDILSTAPALSTKGFEAVTTVGDSFGYDARRRLLQTSSSTSSVSISSTSSSTDIYDCNQAKWVKFVGRDCVGTNLGQSTDPAAKCVAAGGGCVAYNAPGGWYKSTCTSLSTASATSVYISCALANTRKFLGGTLAAASPLYSCAADTDYVSFVDHDCADTGTNSADISQVTSTSIGGIPTAYRLTAASYMLSKFPGVCATTTGCIGYNSVGWLKRTCTGGCPSLGFTGMTMYLQCRMANQNLCYGGIAPGGSVPIFMPTMAGQLYD